MIVLLLLACSDYTVQGEEKPPAGFDSGDSFVPPVGDTHETDEPEDTDSGVIIDTAPTDPCSWEAWVPDDGCGGWFGTGADGGSTLDGDWSTVATTLTADANGTTLTVADAGALAADDELLLLGPDGAYTFARVVSVWGPVEVADVVSFPAGTRVQRVPHYRDVTVGSVVGDVVVFRACGAVTIDTTLSATGRGRAGGRGTTGIPELGWQGEGEAGAGVQSNLANGTGGGGGGESCNVHADGGGGGHATAGGKGPDYSYPCAGPGGDGGGTVGEPELTTLHFGGGGGSGYLDTDATAGSVGGQGGAGGGIVYVAAMDGMVGIGNITADGAVGADGLWIGAASPGGGGGGAGGSIHLIGDVAVPISAVGGGGGEGSEAGGGLTTAGAGGDGRIRVDGAITPTATPTAYEGCR